MTKLDFLKTSLKVGVLSSNILSCKALENNNNKTGLKDIKCKYILKKVFNFVNKDFKCQLVKHNKNLQNKLDLNKDDIKKSLLNLTKEKSQLVISSLFNTTINESIIEDQGYELIYSEWNNNMGTDYYFKLAYPTIYSNTYDKNQKYVLSNFSHLYTSGNKSIYKVEINLKNIIEKLNYIYTHYPDNIDYVLDCSSTNIKKIPNIRFSLENTYLNLTGMCINMKNLSTLTINTNEPIKVLYCKDIFKINDISQLKGLIDLDFSECKNKHFIVTNSSLNSTNVPDELLKYYY